MQCSICHGFGYVDDGPRKSRSKRPTRAARSGGRRGGKTSQGGGIVAPIIFLVGIFIFQWIRDNSQAISDGLWIYVVRPGAALLIAIIFFFLMRFLWRCGKWTAAGFIRYAFNFGILTFFCLALYALAGRIIFLVSLDWRPELALSEEIMVATVVILGSLTGLYLTAKLSRKYGAYGFALDYLRSGENALSRQIENTMLPLFRGLGYGWIKAKEWNDPFVRGFICAQVIELVDVWRPGLTDDNKLGFMKMIFARIMHRSKFSDSDYSIITPISEIQNHPDYSDGYIVGLMFVSHYHNVPGVENGLKQGVRDELAARFKSFAANVKKPEKLKKLPYARRALVNQVWKPRLAAASARE